jgi:hypothetical protein
MSYRVRFVSPTLARLALTPEIVTAYDPAGKGHFVMRRVTINGTSLGKTTAAVVRVYLGGPVT